MKNLLAAVLLAAAAGCGEEPAPPRRPQAPEARPKQEPKAPPAEPQAEKPKPPPDEKPKAPISKVLLDPTLPEWTVTAPATYKVKFATSKGDFVLEVTRDWAPQGADRFYALVKNGFFDDVRFFRVVSNFMAQFGVNGEPQVSAVWRNAKIPDDPNKQTNARGTITFATSGKNSRTTQVFINFKDNAFLDGQGFAPFGKVVEGMEIVDKLNSAYGDGPPRGAGPNQLRIQTDGNEYLKAEFKDLDYVKTARIVQ